MKKTIWLGLLLLNTACGCMLEPGDSAAPGEYWKGCWAEAKKTH